MLDVLDSHNVDRGRTDVDEVYQSLDTKVLTMGFIDDLLYPDDLVQQLGVRFKYHRHFFVPDNVGHDGFCLILILGHLILYHF